MAHRTRDLLRKCEDKVLGEYNIIAEQYTALIAIEYLDDPVRPTDVARWLLRKGNSASMIIDRLVKAGLVRRVRGMHDRRVVRVVITSTRGGRLLNKQLQHSGGLSRKSCRHYHTRTNIP